MRNKKRNSLIKSLDIWSENHESTAVDILRIMLGLALMAKGFIFIAHPQDLVRALDVNFGFGDINLAYAIPYLQLLCGFLIVIGLAVRISCAILIPIVFAAIFWVNIKEGISPTELMFSVGVFIALCLFLLKGSGKFSAYYYIANSSGSRITDESKKAFVGASLDSAMDDKGNLLK